MILWFSAAQKVGWDTPTGFMVLAEMLFLQTSDSSWIDKEIPADHQNLGSISVFCQIF